MVNPVILPDDNTTTIGGMISFMFVFIFNYCIADEDDRESNIF